MPRKKSPKGHPTKTSRYVVAISLLLFIPIGLIISSKFKESALAGDPADTFHKPNTIGAPPRIYTRSLKAAKQSQPYRYEITAYDDISSNIMTMSAEPLPEGITLNDCQNSVTGSLIQPTYAKISCFLTGTSTVSGRFTFSLMVINSQGQKTTQQYNLTVNK